jgi:hypothetical protein
MEKGLLKLGLLAVARPCAQAALFTNKMTAATTSVLILIIPTFFILLCNGVFE